MLASTSASSCRILRPARACMPLGMRPASLLVRPQRASVQASASKSDQQSATAIVGSTLTLASSWLLAAQPALAAENPFSGVQSNSLYVTMALFLMCVPGIWSQVKRAPMAAKKRLVFEVDGPARSTAMSLDDRARQIFRYFKKYNYEVKATGDVITFEGLYAADRGQAAAVTFYTFFGLASIALVLQTVFQEGGNWWYALTLLSPGAWFYYMSRGTRVEQVKVKMVTSDNEQTTDIIVEGDKEEIERFWKELGLVEKGKVLVKGIMAT